MRTNLLYNKIVADTASKGFIESFNEIAVPKLEERFPDVDEVVIYEDYLSDGLFANGSFFCPLTLVKEGTFSHAYASWRCDSKRFENSIPYAYHGKELLNIEILDRVPAAIEAKIDGRVPHFAKNAIKLSVVANAPTKTFLSGKYSQSFVDMMRTQLTRALETEFKVTGIENSSLEITLMFAPESFMEHVLDNVSYRRVLISASSCAPRDLWIKWTRLDGKGTYTVSNHVKENEILFELCDEVPEKIREREYRYLVRTEGQSQFRNAMSRKNFTEWRELMKRVIKRGELFELNDGEEADVSDALGLPEEPKAKYESEISAVTQADAAPEEKEDLFDEEISLKLQSVLEDYNIESDASNEPDEEEEINPDITELLRALISGSGEENGITGDENSSIQEDELPPFDIDEVPSGEEMEALSIISEIESEEKEEEEIEALPENEDNEEAEEIEAEDEETEELNAIIEEFAEIPDLMDVPEEIIEQPAQETDDFAATLMFSLD